MRRFFRWSFFLGSLAVLAGLGLLARRSLSETPRSAYEAGMRAAFGPDRDPELGFMHLEFALRGAEAEGDRSLLREVLKDRARLFISVGSLTRARQDYEEVLERLQPSDRECQLGLAWVLLRLDEDAEALAWIEEVLDDDPQSARALALRGELLSREARRELARAHEVIDVVLPSRERNEARLLIARAAALPRLDPQRARHLQRLATFFPPAEERQQQLTLAAMEAAAARVQGAREAFTASFATQAGSETIRSFLGLLQQSGIEEPAIAFALAAAHLPGATADPAFLRWTLELLSSNGQPHLAADVVELHLGDNAPGPAFYERWCMLLYDLERWEDLLGVAKGLAVAGNDEQRSKAFAYVGLAEAGLERWEDARRVLRPYLLQDPVEPFPGAEALCWVALARGYREAEEPVEEASALRAALRGAGRGRSPFEDEGELWLRLFELADSDPSPSKDRAELEQVLTHAICRQPERVEELLPLWEDVGRRNLEAARVDLALVFEEMLLDRSYAPPAAAGPYEVFQLAQMFAARDANAGVLQACARLMAEYPGFLPALDLAIDARIAIGDQEAAGRLLLDRITLVGPEDEVLDRIESLRPGVLDPEQVMLLMRRDPRRTGRRQLLDGLVGEGRMSEAATALLALPEESLRHTDRVEAARLLLQMGHASEVELALEGLPDEPPWSGRARSLRLAAALQREDWEAFDALLTPLVEAEELDGPGIFGMLDELLIRSPARAATCARLLDASPRWRNGRAMLRLSQALRLEGDLPGARTALVRADAYLVGGQPEVGYLLDAIASRDWGRMPELVVQVRTSALERSPLVEALLDVLGERHSEAAANVLQGGARHSQEPLWALLKSALTTLMGKDLDAGLPGWSPESDAATRVVMRGRDGLERDPREVLGLALALQLPDWRAWAVSVLEHLDEDQAGELWPAYLAARGRLLMGEVEHAAQRTEALAESWPQVPALWTLLEAADRMRSARRAGDAAPAQPPAPDRVSWVRWRQRELLGALPGDPAIEHWLTGLDAEARGEVKLALRAVSRALELRPEDLRFRLTLARLYAADGDWAPALLMMSRAIEEAPGASDGYIAERAIALGRTVRADDPPPAIASLLEEQRALLATHFPTDPLVALELARIDVDEGSAGTPLGLGRALQRLQAFRKRTGNAPLDALRAGSTRAWCEFMAIYDPLLAVTTVRQELRSTPGSIDHWRLVAELAEVAGQRAVALGALQMLQQALPSPEDARAIARLEAQRGADPAAFEGASDAVLVLAGFDEPDLELDLLRAQFLVQAGPRRWNEAIDLLAELWDEVELTALAREPLEGEPSESPDARDLELEAAEIAVGRLYALALAWRGEELDRARAIELLDIVLPRLDDQVELWALTAVRELLAGRLPDPPPEAEVEAGSGD